ncbi:NUDIX hydrolase [[Clostridium] polysaccharolyticum]|uniref:8-oxo-dGTP diphosphatase n=1 Tax=[Clostridium] polysaccharolyticum TaxID=29364 RepID=A0A1H9ZC61_9FIRM|nr:NUDIX domain-containing protein [[Clostridium] polysaccharolyticum]SES78426.1 8-oxo-dGTP diphosphatase [[Clostridium] polysaccharolyticum]
MIDKIGGVILKDKKILVVRKRTKANFKEFIIPGGKREGQETDLETLSRELKEELNIDLISANFMGEYTDIAVFENVPIKVRTYLTKVSGDMKVENEIKEYIWIDRNYKEKQVKLGSILEKFVIPQLIAQDLM